MKSLFKIRILRQRIFDARLNNQGSPKHIPIVYKKSKPDKVKSKNVKKSLDNKLNQISDKWDIDEIGCVVFFMAFLIIIIVAFVMH